MGAAVLTPGSAHCALPPLWLPPLLGCRPVASKHPSPPAVPELKRHWVCSEGLQASLEGWGCPVSLQGQVGLGRDCHPGNIPLSVFGIVAVACKKLNKASGLHSLL